MKKEMRAIFVLLPFLLGGAYHAAGKYNDSRLQRCEERLEEIGINYSQVHKAALARLADFSRINNIMEETGELVTSKRDYNSPFPVLDACGLLAHASHTSSGER